MSEKIICDKSDLVAIADTVREKNGSSETFSVPELSAAAVQAIQTGGGSRDAVLYTEQVLTEEQKTQARENIGAQAVINGVAGQIVGFNANGKPVAQKAPSGDTVLFVKQNLTGAQKTQARKNIEAAKNWDELDGKPFYESITRGREIVAETTVTVDPESNDIMFDPALFTGEETGLYIEFDGISYECARNEFSGFGVFGNMAAVEGEDTGEPFALAVAPSMGMVSMLLMNPDAEPHTVRIEELHIELKKIEGKFIDSEWLATRTVQDIVGLPQTTFTFNGGAYTIGHPIALENYRPISCMVNWNQQEYECEVLASGAYWLIGMNLETFEPTGEYPFGIVLMGAAMGIFPIAGDETSTNTVSITFKVKAPVTIPSGFLPLATEDTAGAMSAADKAKLDRLKNATTSADGLMSATDKTKLDSLSIDATLAVSGAAADAKVVGDTFTEINSYVEGAAMAASLALPGSLKWDGVIGDRAYVSMEQSGGMMMAYVHVSDEVPTLLEPTAFVSMSTVEGMSMAMALPLEEMFGAYGCEGAIIVPIDNFAPEGMPFTFPKKGVYVMAQSLLPSGMDISIMYVSAFKPMGYSFAEIGGGGSGSGESCNCSEYFETVERTTVAELGDTLTWDGEIGDRVHMTTSISDGTVPVTFVKISDVTPTYEELSGKTIEIVRKMGSNSQTISDAPTEPIDNIMDLGYSSVAIIYENNTAYTIGDQSVVLPEKGLYCITQEVSGIGFVYASSITIPGYNFTNTSTESREIIKTEHLPEALQFGEITTHGDTFVLLEYDHSSLLRHGDCYLLTEATFTEEDYKRGVTVHIMNKYGTEYVHELTDEGAYFTKNSFRSARFVYKEESYGTVGTNFYMALKENATQDGNTFPKKGLWMYYADMDQILYISIRVKGYMGFAKSQTVTIDPEYMPETNNLKLVRRDLHMPSSSEWISISYGNGKFVAGAYRSGKAGIVAVSKNGMDWEESYNVPTHGHPLLVYGDGMFILTFKNGSTKYMAYSYDGEAWYKSVLPAEGTWTPAAYGDGKYVTIKSGSNIAAYSFDGKNWMSTTIPASGTWRSVTYGAGKFVAVAAQSDVAAYSMDGITWIETTMPKSTYWCGVYYGDGKFVATSNGYSKGAYSMDGITWESCSSIIKGETIAYGSGMFVSIGDRSVSNETRMSYSRDGITWHTANLPTPAIWTGVAYGGGRFVAIAANTNMLAYSTDGIHWTSDEYVGVEQRGEDVTDSIRDLMLSYTDSVVINSSTAGSTKKFRITVDDSGTISATEVI